MHENYDACGYKLYFCLIRVSFNDAKVINLIFDISSQKID